MVNPFSRALRENPTTQEIARRVAAGLSPNYRGDYRLARNRPANISSEQNCSVWITGLPPNSTENQLLGAIRDTGRVWACVMHPPTRLYGTAAAKVTFFTAAAAQVMLGRTNADGPGRPGLVVGDHCAVVRPDRNPVAEATEPEDHTRVISIAGPREVVTVDNLAAFFRKDFIYEVDEIIPLVTGKVINVLEWRFASYRCQSQWAWRKIQDDAGFQASNVRVRFERDPCDQGGLALPLRLLNGRGHGTAGGRTGPWN
jgi:hypothetical protein